MRRWVLPDDTTVQLPPLPLPRMQMRKGTPGGIQNSESRIQKAVGGLLDGEGNFTFGSSCTSDGGSASFPGLFARSDITLPHSGF